MKENKKWTTPLSVRELEFIWEKAPPVLELPLGKSKRKILLDESKPNYFRKSVNGIVLALAIVSAIVTIIFLTKMSENRPVSFFEKE